MFKCSLAPFSGQRGTGQMNKTFTENDLKKGHGIRAMVKLSAFSPRDYSLRSSTLLKTNQFAMNTQVNKKSLKILKIASQYVNLTSS